MCEVAFNLGQRRLFQQNVKPSARTACSFCSRLPLATRRTSTTPSARRWQASKPDPTWLACSLASSSFPTAREHASLLTERCLLKLFTRLTYSLLVGQLHATCQPARLLFCSR
ncbi:hypothetical protein T4E_12030 [Trichinella pseudospiralis]|uniref:Uncharacterized protein n=1 Tax=Trichinella pseudospiralis TaxID=6337 RepID=A0A0V0Y198_TRIPS|nr:hypothetical protein T4E_12030 [Trichinella pseudospiralis]